MRRGGPGTRGRSWILAVGLCTGACGSEDPTPPPMDKLDFTGTWNPSTNFGGPWGHDGQPVSSDNFIVYSDAASPAARQHAADVGEEVLAEILDYYGVTTAALTFLPSYADPKIHFLALKDQRITNTTAFAYRDGLVTVSQDSPQYSAWGISTSRYKRIIKHETTHVVEFLLIGTPAQWQASDVWWREGIANLLSGPRPTTITTRAQVEDWMATHASLAGEGNPLAIHTFANFPPEVLNAGEAYTYYDMFELSVRYFLDPDGVGGTPQDVVDLYDTMGSGFTFSHAVQTHFGVDLAALQADYWSVILDFLDRTTP